jgi:hypothetical protein
VLKCLYMPAIRHGLDCNCCAPAPASQSLDEVAFSRSAAAAAQRGDYFKVKTLVERNPAQLHCDGHQGASGYTPLHYASRENHADVVSLLLSLGKRPLRAAGGLKCEFLALLPAWAHHEALPCQCGACDTSWVRPFVSSCSGGSPLFQLWPQTYLQERIQTRRLPPARQLHCTAPRTWATSK